MSPFSGEGANLAMQDAADLAVALATHQDWRTAVVDFELVMFGRAEKAASGASEGINDAFSKDGLVHTLKQMASHRSHN